MDHRLEALVGFVGAHGDTLELLELAEEILDQVTPFVHLGVDLERGGAARMLRDHDCGAALVEVGDDLVAVEGPCRRSKRRTRRPRSAAPPRWCRSAVPAAGRIGRGYRGHR